MRLFLLTLFTALIVPFAAYSESLKEVIVVNDPLAVEVVNPVTIVEPVIIETIEPIEVEVINPAPPSQPVHFQLVGFTSVAYKGAMGGFFGVTKKCQLEFPNSRMCLLDEVAATTSIPSGLAGKAWTDSEITGSSTSCSNWSSTSYSGKVVASNGIQTSGGSCNVATPIACCALVP